MILLIFENHKVFYQIIFSYAYLSPTDWDVDKYDSGLKKYNENEQVAMKLFDMLDRNSKNEIILFIEKTGIPKWKECIEILNEMNTIENLPQDFQKQNQLLLGEASAQILFDFIRESALLSAESITQCI